MVFLGGPLHLGASNVRLENLLESGIGYNKAVFRQQVFGGSRSAECLHALDLAEIIGFSICWKKWKDTSCAEHEPQNQKRSFHITLPCRAPATEDEHGALRVLYTNWTFQLQVHHEVRRTPSCANPAPGSINGIMLSRTLKRSAL